MSARLIGQILEEQYRVDEFIAAGGMGAVYRVWDLKRSVPLAMKVLHADLSDDPSAAKRFQREANALKDLAHPNIVPFYGLHHAPDFFFLLTAFVDGPSLKELIARRRGQPFSPAEAITFLKGLSAALGYAHVNGFVHCDVKPGNVLLDQTGSIFLTDFGIARTTTGLTTSTLGTAGTPAYMSPEQIRGDALTPAADIYSLGVLFFELITGQRPFRGDEAETQSTGRSTGERIIYAHLNLPAPDPRQLNPSIPAVLAQAVLQALVKSPEKRFASTHLFYTACTDALGLNPAVIPARFRLAAAYQQGGEQTLAASRLLEKERQEQLQQSRDEDKIHRPQRPAWLIPAIGAGIFIFAICLIAGLGYALSLGLSPKQAQGPPPASVTAPLVQSIQLTHPPPVESATAPVAAASIPPEPTASPTKSPDWHQGKLVFPGASDNGRVLFLLNLAAGSDPVLLVAPPAGQRFMGPAWSPDGERIAFYNQTTKEILVMDAIPGETPAIFTEGTQPAWSPDGNQILYRAGEEYFDIREVATNEHIKRLKVPPAANLPDWSPQGDVIAYAILASTGSTSIWKQAIAGGDPILLNDRSFQNYAPSWSHDGRLIAYQSDKHSENSEVWVMDRNGDNARRLTNTPTDAWSRAPSWSPDDQWIAFVSSQAGSIGSDYGEVFIVPAAGGDPIQITFTGGSVYDWRIDWGK